MKILANYSKEFYDYSREVTEAIIKYFKDNKDILNDCIEELDSYNGYLRDDKYFSMEDLDEFFSGESPLEIITRAFYGYDAIYDSDTGSYLINLPYSKDYKNLQPFNPNREYFAFNGYGNLVSSDYRDYSVYLDEDLVYELLDNIDEISTLDSNNTLKQMFNELEQLKKEFSNKD